MKKIKWLLFPLLIPCFVLWLLFGIIYYILFFPFFLIIFIFFILPIFGIKNDCNGAWATFLDFLIIPFLMIKDIFFD